MTLNLAAGTGVVLAGGQSLEWASFGPDATGEAPVIVMLHEGLGSIALWRDFPARLAAATGLAVFAYSRAGYGKSDAADLPRPLDYMTREAVSVLPDVLSAIKTQGYVLLGHSDGATIAAEYAGRMNDPRLKGLILMAPHFFTEPMGLAEIASAKTAFESTDLRVRMIKYHNDAEATFRGWNDAWLAPGFKAWNVAEVIRRFKVPVLAIQGRQDQYGTIAQIEALTERSPTPVETVLLQECRHSPHFDQPEKTLAAISSFVKALARHPSEEESVL